MTPEERAQLIKDWFYSDTPEEGDLTFISAQIREAEEAGRNEIRNACSQHQHEQYSDGFKSGFLA